MARSKPIVTVSVFGNITNHWAKENMQFVAARVLLSGTGTNRFAPDDAMTQEQMAAKEVAAMQWAGIVKGKDGNHFDPQASATRAGSWRSSLTRPPPPPAG